jgi:hypothetical protein
VVDVVRHGDIACGLALGEPCEHLTLLVRRHLELAAEFLALGLGPRVRCRLGSRSNEAL